jgi:hypothetical protein
MQKGKSMATKTTDKNSGMDQDLLNEIMGATAARPKGKFLVDGQYVIKITNHGHQKPGTKSGTPALVFDGEVICTSADYDSTRATRKGDPAHWRYNENESFAGNCKAITVNLGCTPAELLYGNALVGECVVVQATTIKTKDGNPFTLVNVLRFASGSEDFKAHQAPRGVDPKNDDAIPF